MKLVLFNSLVVISSFVVSSSYSLESNDDGADLSSVDRSKRYHARDIVDKTREEDNGDKKRKHRRSCCGDNDDVKLIFGGDGGRDVKKECFDRARRATEANKSGRMEVEEYEGFIHGNRTKDEYICTVQCIGQNKEILDRMGNVKKSEMGEYVRKSYSSEPWKAAIADSVFEKCFSETQKPSEGEVTTDNGDVTNGRSVRARCNANGIAFVHCLWREMQLNCPAEKQRETKKCNRLRERLRLRESKLKNGTTRSLF